MKLTFALLSLLFVAANAGAGHDWEWAAVFDLHATSEVGPYTFQASKKEGKTSYAEETIFFLYLKTTTKDKAGLEAAEVTAQPLFADAVDNNQGYTNVSSGSNVVNLIPGTVYKLNFDAKSYVSTYKLGGITEANEGAYVVFLEHLASEIEGTAGHYLKDQNGKDIEPSYVDGVASVSAHEDSHGGLTFLATFLVTAIALMGLLLVMPFWRHLATMQQELVTQFTELSGMFASGCLLATAFMLILPEALHLVTDQYKNEGKVNFFTGVFANVGFLVGPLVCWTTQYTLSRYSAAEKTGKQAQVKDVEMSNATDTLKTNEKKQGVTANEVDGNIFLANSVFEFVPSRWRGVSYIVLVGDFFHNFCDGIAIGIAFSTCGTSMGWTVTLSAAAHEFSQELADFFVLTTKGRMSPASALLFNFISGCSCIIGGIVGSQTDMSNGMNGALLAFSAGTYIYIGGAEMFVQLRAVENAWTAVKRALCFIVGVTVIALVLIGHEHCVPGSSAGGHGHHGHGH
eukprot:g5446.t1